MPIPDPNCSSFQELITAAVDDELSPDESSVLHAHLQSCPDCRQEYELEGRTKRTVKTNLPSAPAPAGLALKIQLGIERERIRERRSKSGKRSPIGLAGLVAFLMLTAGCERRPAQEQPRPATERLEPSPSGSVRNVASVQDVEQRAGRAPNFSWRDHAGSLITFDDTRGRVTLLNIWATWCGPCRREMPDLIALSEELADRNVRFIGISVDRGPDAARLVERFVAQARVPYQIVIANSKLEAALGNPAAIPTTLIVDEQGRIVETIVGQRSKQIFAQAIARALPSAP